MIFFRKDPVLGVDLENAINNAVFPGLQVLYNQSFCIFVDVLLALLHVIYQRKSMVFSKHRCFCRVGLIIIPLLGLQCALNMLSLMSLKLTRNRSAFCGLTFYVLILQKKSSLF